jgi:hypothetical protein
MSPEQNPEGASSIYTNVEARAIFRRAMMDGSVIVTKHARARMRDCGLDHNDLLHLSRNGAVVNPPEPDIRTGEWLYRIETRDMKAQFVIIGQSKVRLVTCFAAEP